MKLLIIIVSTLIIWAILTFAFFAIISFARYAWQEIIHSFNNAKRGAKQILIDIEWAWRHR